MATQSKFACYSSFPKIFATIFPFFGHKEGFIMYLFILAQYFVYFFFSEKKRSNFQYPFSLNVLRIYPVWPLFLGQTRGIYLHNECRSKFTELLHKARKILRKLRTAKIWIQVTDFCSLSDSFSLRM